MTQSSLPTQLTMSRRSWALLLGLSLLWGGSFLFIELALRGLSPLTVVFARVLLAALALHLYIRLRGLRMPLDPGLWRSFLVMGLVNNLIPFSLIVWGQVYIGAGLASILNATTPLFTVVLAHFLTQDERLTPSKAAGVLLGLSGVVILIGPGALGGLGTHVLAQLAVAGAGLAYALAGIYGRRFRGLPTVYTAAGMLSCSALMLLPFVLVLERPWHLRPDPVAVLAVLALALLSTAAAYLIYFHLLSLAGATNVLLVTLLIPVSAATLGVLVLGEALSPGALAGMALIMLGLVAVDGRAVRGARARLKPAGRR